MSESVVVVGGGLAGLTAAVYLARAGRSVTVFERRRVLGGRAVTHIRQGYRFNLGPHAVYRGGAAASVYRELGVPVRGGVAPAEGLALFEGRRYRLPSSGLSTALTSLLSAKAKLEAARLFTRLTFLDPDKVADVSVREWLDDNVSDARLRQSVEALMRLSTYAADTRQSALTALRQLKIAQRGVIYVHEGWQKLVDSLHSQAVTAGVNFVTSAHVVSVEHDGGEVRGVEIGELELDDRNDTVALAMPGSVGDQSGTRIPARRVILAVDPPTVTRLLGGDLDAGTSEQVTMATLDVALTRLPDPKAAFALGIDQPHYLSAHSKWAQLTPKGGALLHVARYRTAGDDAAEPELEAILDQLQPSWRDLLVHRRFLPSMVVSNSLSLPGASRMQARTPIRGLYVAGDWVGDEGILSDAALASARTAAQAVQADS